MQLAAATVRRMANKLRIASRWEGKLMVSGSNLRIHGPAGESFNEIRLVDSPDLRLAEIVASTNPSQIGVLRDRILGAFQEFQICGEGNDVQACMAIEEALANAIYHGNLELDSRLKEDGSTAFSDLARERCDQQPWCERSVKVIELATPFGVWLTISDQGRGFDFRKALQRTLDPEALLASGRGLVMMRAFTDELIFNAVGNEVTMVFYSKRNMDVKDMLAERVGNNPSSKERTAL